MHGTWQGEDLLARGSVNEVDELRLPNFFSISHVEIWVRAWAKVAAPFRRREDDGGLSGVRVKYRKRGPVIAERGDEYR